MANASITLSYGRNYPYNFVALPGTGQTYAFETVPSFETPGASLTNNTTNVLSCYIDATNVTSGSPCIALMHTSGAFVYSAASVAPGYAGTASVSFSASTTPGVTLWPVLSAEGVTTTVGGALVFSQPQITQNASYQTFPAAGNKVPDPYFAAWYQATGASSASQWQAWGTTPPPAEVYAAGGLFTAQQPLIACSVNEPASVTASAWQMLVYTYQAYSAVGFVAGQATGQVWNSFVQSGAPGASIQITATLPNNTYMPVMQVTSNNGSVTNWVAAPMPFTMLVGTPKLGLNLWALTGTGGTLARTQENSDADTVDPLVQIVYPDIAANLSKYGAAVGGIFCATDTAAIYLANGAGWQQLLEAPDVPCLSSALPSASPSNTGVWYHCTDTDQIFRSNGAAMIQVLTGSTIGQFNGTPPSGIVMTFPAVWSGSAGSWTLKESSAPSGWVYALGQPYSTTTYADLFAVIGYSWTWKNTANNNILSASGLTGDQGPTADYIVFGSTSGNSSTESGTTSSYQQITTGTTFCVPNLSGKNLGIAYQSGTTTSSATTPPATLPIIKL